MLVIEHLFNTHLHMCGSEEQTICIYNVAVLKAIVSNFLLCSLLVTGGVIGTFFDLFSWRLLSQKHRYC